MRRVSRQGARSDARGSVRWKSRILILAFLLASAIIPSGARADDEDATVPAQQPTLVTQASAPLSNILQIRTQDSYVREFTGLHGQGNALTMAVTMPLPAYRLLPFPQLSLLTMPTAVTSPGGSMGLGDLRLLDIAVLEAGHGILWGIGPTLVFPTASQRAGGQGKWQLGPATAVAFTPERWLIGLLAQNPISFAGDRERNETNALFLQPFVTYQLGRGWFVRSQPQMVFNWKTGNQVLPVDLGVGRVFEVGRQYVSSFVEPFWNASADGPTPVYGFTFGVSLLYPNFWQRSQIGTEPRR